MKKAPLLSTASKPALLALAGSILLTAAPALAQDVGDEPGMVDDEIEDVSDVDGVGDIIVTAQRREESAQSVPIAISAFDGNELARRGVTEALQIAQFVPNLVALNNTGIGSANAYFLRGLGNTETIPTFDPPIGTYVDDVYLARQNANNLSLFDVARVEVLRGPQGTLFGRNTTGGAVSIFLDDPDFEVGGYAEVAYGAYEQTLARASIDLPVSDTLAFKVSGYWQNDDGYAFNTTTDERVNESDGYGVRVGMLAELSDAMTVTASYMRTNTEAANVLNFDCDPANPSNCDGRFVTTGLTADSDTVGLLTGDKANFGLGNDSTVDFATVNVELDVSEALTLNSITGYVRTDQDYLLDFADGRGLPSISTPVPPVIGYTFGGFTIVNEGTFEQFSQELKLTGSIADGLFDFVTGVYFFREQSVSDFSDVFSLPFGPLPRGLPLVLADRTLSNETDAYAGYLQGDLNVTDALTLTAGIRYTRERKAFSISDNRASCRDGSLEVTCVSDANLVAANGTPIPREQEANVWTPRFAINYDVNPDILLFASATRGFKSGGWNARGTSASELLPFDPEFAWSYEAGFKADVLDDRLRVNLTVYQLDVDNLQTPSAFTRANGSIAFITRNFADYRNRGVELELNAVPIDGLSLFGAFGYQDDEYRFDPDGPDFDAFGVESVLSQQSRCQAQLASGLVAGGDATACGQGIVAPDGSIATPVRTPDFTVALGGSYRAELTDTLTLIPAINASWRDDSETGTSNVTIFDAPITSSGGRVYPANVIGDGELITGSFSEASWLLNATLTLASDSGFSLIAECRNCLDEERVESTLANYSYLNPPRTFLLRARYEF